VWSHLWLIRHPGLKAQVYVVCTYRSVTLILCQIVEATSCHKLLQYALLARSGTQLLRVSQAAWILELLMTGQDHISCICKQLQSFLITMTSLILLTHSMENKGTGL